MVVPNSGIRDSLEGFQAASTAIFRENGIHEENQAGAVGVYVSGAGQMMTQGMPTATFSADVRITLLIGDATIPLATVGPKSAVPVEPVEIAPRSSGVLVVSVDGREHRWDIYIKNGAFPPIDDIIRFKIQSYHRTIDARS